MEIYGNLVFSDNSIISLYKDSPIYKAYLEAVNGTINRDPEFEKYAQGYTSFTARVSNGDKESDGATLIGLDTAIYTADSTSDGKDGHQETNGRITNALIKWVVDEVEKANKRNDVVALMSHHAFVPHFENQEKFLSPYIINEWDKKLSDSDERINGKTPAEIFADMGVKFLFTGHLHAHDVAKFVSKNGNEFFDIQTGSTVTYPLPIHHITITNNISSEEPGFTLEMNTDLIESFTFIDPKTGEEVTVEDALEYASGNQLTPELVSNLANGYLGKYINGFNSKELILGLVEDKTGLVIPKEGYGELLIPVIGGLLGEDGKVINTGDTMVTKVTIGLGDIQNKDLYGKGKKIGIKADTMFGPAELLIRGVNIEKSIDSILAQVDSKVVTRENVSKWIYKIVEKMMAMPVEESENLNETKTLTDVANDAYRAYLRGDEVQPEYITTFINKYREPGADLVVDMVKFAAPTVNEVFEEISKLIEYRLIGDDSEENFHGTFIRNLIEAEYPDNGMARLATGLLPGFTGENIDETLSNETIVKAIYGKDTTKEKVAIMDLVETFLGINVITDQLNSLASILGEVL